MGNEKSKRLTQLGVDRLKPPATGREIHWDATLPGFGVRVSFKDRKTWIAMYRVKGRLVMETLGTTALIPKLADAQQLARESMLKARRGVNPVAERREQAAKADDSGGTTLKEVFDAYRRKYLLIKSKAGTAKNVEQYFAKDVITKLGKRDINSITSADLRRVLEAIQDRGAPVAANRMLARLRTFFRWCVKQEHIASDPTAKLDKLVQEIARDRVLDDDELKLFWQSCDQVGRPYGPLGKLLLLTAQRRNEVAEAAWDELDLDKQLWVIPKERSKNGLAHEVHLSPLACEILAGVPRINGSRYVFTTAGAKPVNSWSDAKARFDRRMGSIPHWTFHDLRRSAASHMARFAPPHVVDKILNHSTGSISGVAAIYNRHRYLDERKAALEAWSRHIELLLNPEPSNVVPMTAAVQG